MSENISSQAVTTSDVPDFRWPERVCDGFKVWSKHIWIIMTDKVESAAANQPLLRNLLQAIFWTGILYVALLWIFACYVHFPVAPYGLWNIVGWIIMVGFLIIALGSLFFGMAAMSMFLWYFLLSALFIALSLPHLCCTVYDALRKKAVWLRSYQIVLIAGIISVFILATYIDGSYRFWDSPFDILAWVRSVIITLFAWAFLFCYAVRDKIMDAKLPLRIMIWTLGLGLAVGLCVHWNAGGQKNEYFLVKSVRAHPNDQKAWLNLASYYKQDGDSTAGQSGDDEHQPADPTSSYKEALQCYNRAVELGAMGYEVNLARAQSADAIGKKHDALVYGQLALENSSTVSPSQEIQTDTKWLHEMLTRNAIAPNAEEKKEDRAHQVRKQRVENLPIIFRWVYSSSYMGI